MHEAPQQLTHYQRYKETIIASVKRYVAAHKDDQEYLEARRKRDREAKRAKYHSNPEYREKIRMRSREQFYINSVRNVPIDF